MIEVLSNSVFRRLFVAQVVALVGTGLATVALALLAYDLAGAQAGAVLGTALAIKMMVYVTLAPVSAAVVPPSLRKPALIALDLIRAAAALSLPFVTAVWQVYILIALLQSASACFTPLFQSLIPEILKEERKYTRALSLSRLAYDLESLLSPALAAALLTLISFHGLFVGTSAGFVLSALLVLSTTLPLIADKRGEEGPYARAIRGMRIYLRTPRLRGLLALNLVAAAGGAMVFVNTVVVVRSVLHGGDREVAWALAAFGAGSMLVALLLPRVLDRVPDRRVMLGAAAAMCGILVTLLAAWLAERGAIGWAVLLPVWTLLGMAYAGLVTPGGRLLRRSAESADLPFLFAAQFSLSHVCWLIAYPLAGVVGARLGMPVTIAALSVLALAGVIVAWRVWPKHDPDELTHRHDDLPEDHPHLIEHRASNGGHRHRYVIDPLHEHWPQ
ncbi:MFS transporter [Xanthomonas oryzae]|uniref:MFS transporter n=1 Tax=Xanthomonas oryzae TaxID=347 RepID=UPI0006A6697C|nr:MFS transporter [Xanthomonas oryzae]AKJ75457.1 major facilitator transporter [Xanthomonas oryzae pv. oryzicola]UBB91443.1 MFS transporter [Xanthomonas oryzae pv. oryzicola]UBB91503.1 MFS transporter [Xanthomonas oryzae pv. oryzicola]